MNLIRKDFILGRTKRFAYLSLCLFLLVFLKITMKEAHAESVFMVVLGVLFAYYNTFVTFEAEGKQKVDSTIVTLPYERKDIVKAKYESILLVSVFYYICCYFIEAFFLLGVGVPPGQSIIYGIEANILVHAFMIPVFIRFEYVKASHAMMVILMVLGAGFSILSQKISQIKPTVFLPNESAYVVFLLVAIIIFFISYLISVTIYQKKQFY